MTTAILLTVFFAIAALTAYSFRQKCRGRSGKRVMRANLLAFILISALVICACSFTAAAAGEQPDAAPVQPAPTETVGKTDNSKGYGLVAAALVTGLAGLGGGLAVAAGAPAAIAATSEDPKSFGKSLIFVALGESIALYGVVISILILNKI